MAKTKIEWADYTFNPWVGCSKVSPGCQFCYAETFIDKRFGKAEWGPNGTRTKTSPGNWKKPIQWDKQAKAKGVKYRVFCASLADVFEDREELVPWRSELFDLIEATPNLIWMLLTKRPENVHKMIPTSWFMYDAEKRKTFFCDNVWIGTSVENQEQANIRIPHLLRVPIKVRFLSCEPLLGPVDLRSIIWSPYTQKDAPDIKGVLRDEDEIDDWAYWVKRGAIDWVIVGGESGSKARPMHPDWVRSLRDQCMQSGTAFFFKQWGRWATIYDRDIDDPDWSNTSTIVREHPKGRWLNLNGGHGFHGDRVLRVVPVGKKNTGRLLDGTEWNQFPEVNSGDK